MLKPWSAPAIIAALLLTIPIASLHASAHKHHRASQDQQSDTPAPRHKHHRASRDQQPDTPAPRHKHHRVSQDQQTDESSNGHQSKHERLIAAKKAAHLKARHLARVAAQQKAEWRDHIAKVRSLPRKERLALKRHERRYKQQQADQQEAKLQQARDEKSAKAAAAHHRHLLALRAAKQNKLARHHKALPEKVAENDQPDSGQPVLFHHQNAHQRALLTAHNLRVAALQRHNTALAAHNRRAAELQRHNSALAAHNARLAKIQSAHDRRVQKYLQLAAQRSALHNARLIKQRSVRNARIAANRSKWVALHGDGSGGQSIQFWQTEVSGVAVKVITVDLNDSNVKISAVMSRWGNGTSEPFRNMIARANPNVAVTGTFFSLDNMRPVGDIVIDGSLVHFGGMGTALCITPENKADMVTVEWGRHHNWKSYDFVCACGPRLLHHGHVVLDPHSERFKDQHMLAPNSRIAVGITQGNKIVFAMTRQPIYLGRLAKVMRGLGVSEAMNLDAGTSTGFYYNGITLAKPGRRLTNMIVVYGRKDRYEHALDQLMPAAYRHVDSGHGARPVTRQARN